MAPCGAIPVSALFLVAMLDHDPITVMVVPAMMPIMMMTALDDDLLSIGNGRRRDSDRTDGSKYVSKFLHSVLLLRMDLKLHRRKERSALFPREF